MAKSKEYWLNRTKDIVAKSEKNEDTVVKELAEIYEYATKELEKDLQAFYGKYATETGISIRQAKVKIRQADISSFNNDIKRFIKKGDSITDKEIEQWRLLRAKFNVTRMDLLINEMEMKLIDIYGDVQITMEEHLKRVANETYYETAGMVGGFARLPIQEIEDIVNFPWSGAMFSDLLWGHKDQLIKSLRKNITTGLIRGDSIQNMARALRKEVDSSVYASERLIRTETNATMNQATIKGYADNDVLEYEFNANIDEKTSTVCRHHDGKIYKISEAKVGINLPALHPSCRSYITPVVD